MPRIQARIVIPEAFRAAIEPIRLKWNPEHSIGNPAHVTIVYHDEAPDENLLISRLRAALQVQEVFPLELGRAQRFPDPERGAFLDVADPSGVVTRIRGRVLFAPFGTRARFGLHATVLHPRHGDRLVNAWSEIQALPALGRFTVDEIQVVGSENQTIASLRLSDSSP